MNRTGLDATYYQALHDEHPAFQNNNWMTQDLDTLRKVGGSSLLELGCGNGRFLAAASAHWERVVGVDWARSPVIDEIITASRNVEFIQCDVLAWASDEVFDLVVSADFLEHLDPAALPHALAAFHRLGRNHFHRIACYDDGHSHLSIFPPETWLGLFNAAVPGAYRLLSTEARKGNADKLVITIGTF